MTRPSYSPGLENVIAGKTAISSLAGGLRYRGYAIEDLADHANFEEVAYLLLHGELPSAEQLDEFQRRLHAAAEVPPELVETLRRLPPTADPMDVLRSSCSLLALWDPDRGDNSHEANVRKAERLLAQLPLVLAAAHRLRQGKQPVPAESGRSLADNCLYMLFRADPPDSHVRAMNVSLVLYAEHEFNASAFTARVIASTLADLHSAVTGAIGALKGALDGGASARALDLLRQIRSAGDAENWVRDALARKERIMGFGHRVYKHGDPRATCLKSWCAKLAAETGNEQLEATADAVERVVRQVKGLWPNLDWPSGRLYYYLGLPVELYTPLFVLSRTAGWGAHVIEQLDGNRLIRPRARYVGHAHRPWVALAER